MTGVDINLPELIAYISGLEDQTSEIQRLKSSLDEQFNSLKEVWKDEQFLEFASKYSKMSDSFTTFLTLSKKIVTNLNTKRIVLTNYLK